MTGTQSYFTLFEDHQVMFHVSTLLPYSTEDTQQVFDNQLSIYITNIKKFNPRTIVSRFVNQMIYI